MSYTVEITAQAEEDIRSIFEYIAYKLKSYQNAVGQIERLEKNILGLNEMPERYVIYAKEPWHSRGLRTMPVDNYLVFYIPYDDAKTVKIIRVMYGGRDIDTQLNK